MSSAVQNPSETDLDALFQRSQERLRRTVRLRLDRRLSGIVDSSGVLEMAREEALHRRGRARRGRCGRCRSSGSARSSGEVLQRLHQRAARPRRPGRYLALSRRPAGGHVGLAGRPPAGQGGGEDDQAAARAEQKILLQETLNAMDPLDREVLTLRHCEQLSNDETADRAGDLDVRGQRGLHPRPRSGSA